MSIPEFPVLAPSTAGQGLHVFTRDRSLVVLLFDYTVFRRSMLFHAALDRSVSYLLGNFRAQLEVYFAKKACNAARSGYFRNSDIDRETLHCQILSARTI